MGTHNAVTPPCIWVARLLTLQRFLTPVRRKYPLFIGGALWGAWILSLLLGLLGNQNSPTDQFGQLIGTDFVAFYTAGRIVASGEGSELYSLDLAHEIQLEIYQTETENFNPYLNPPFYALLFVPFSKLPYAQAAVLWMGMNLGLLWLSIRLLDPESHWRKFWLILTWLPAWAAITFGQNAFLSVFILSLVYILWKNKHHFLAGMVLGLLLYKPQLVIGVGFLWLVDIQHRWKNLAGMIVTGVILGTISVIIFPQATLSYFDYALHINANLMTFEAFPIWNAHGVQTFFITLLPGNEAIAQVFYAVCAVLGMIVFVNFLRHQQELPLQYAGAICLTLWITPYVMVYDWSILVIAAILLWQARPQQHPAWEVLYAIMWVVMFISSALTAIQWRFLGIALQISVPMLALVLAATYQVLREAAPLRKAPAGAPE